MDNRFLREILWTNFVFIGAFILMIIVANLYYGTAGWLGALPLAILLALALVLKIRIIKARAKDVDERMEYITYR
ncbi:MAG: hypothetical protein Q8N93_02215, partial [Bacillota bacterium]|nr:hypothetical protein [Bacillota bacterium]